MSQIHDRLDWNLLRTFLAIVQEGSISRAAVRLHLTQPAVSLALKRLEERLGENLIARSGSSFTVTTAGELVYRQTCRLKRCRMRTLSLSPASSLMVYWLLSLSIAPSSR